MKKLIVVMLLAVATSFLWGSRRQRLHALQAEVAVLRGHSLLAEDRTSLSSDNPAHPVSPDPGRQRAQTIEQWSIAGGESLAEARACLKRLVDQIRTSGTQIPDRRPIPDLLRLKELLATMGAGMAEKLFEELSLPEDHSQRRFATEWLEQIYCAMNPPQGLLLMLAKPEGEDRDHSAAKAFDAWSYSDPAAALRWYREALHAGELAAKLPAVQERALACESHIDPARAVADMAVLIRDRPGDISPDRAALLMQETQTLDERLFLLKALSADGPAAGNADLTATVALMRSSVLHDQRTVLKQMQQRYAEIIPLIDGSYTAEEQRDFARTRVQWGMAADYEKWCNWLARIDFPEGETNPLINLDPSTAAKAIQTLQPGPERRKLADELATKWAGQDPAAAQAWRDQEASAGE